MTYCTFICEIRLHHNLQQKLTAILETIQHAQIPWTTEIDNLVQCGRKLDHAL